MKKKILATLVVAAATISVASAQVKGHSYYKWEGSLGKDINVEVLMELDNESDMALGSIRYLRKSGQTSEIPLYGSLSTSEGTDMHYTLYEHLPNGKHTGILGIDLRNGTFLSGQWVSPDSTRQYPFNVKKTRPFDFSTRQTYFEPLSDNTTTVGVYRSVFGIKGDSEERNVFEVTINDEKTYPYIGQAGSGRTHRLDFLFNNQWICDGQFQPFENGKFLFTSNGATFSCRVFNDFLYIEPVYDPSPDRIASNLVGGYYMRQANERLIPMVNFQLGMWARLKDGVVTVSYVRQILEMMYADEMPDFYMCLDGFDLPLEGVDGHVADIFCGDLGIGSYPILSLLLDDGDVQTFSAMQGVLHGIQSVSPRLPWLHNITRFAHESTDSANKNLHDEYEGFDTYFAIDREGHSHELQRSMISADWMHNFGSEAKGMYTCLSFNDNWEMWYHHGPNYGEDGVGVNYYGTFWPAEHIDGEELPTVYRYHFTHYNTTADPGPEVIDHKCDLKGTFRIELDNQNEKIVIRIIPIEGMNFEIPEGEIRWFEHTISRG